MPRKSKDPNGFDQAKYINEWSAANMKTISARYKNEFVEEFKAACKQLGISQSDVIRKAAEAVIEEARSQRQ